MTQEQFIKYLQTGETPANADLINNQFGGFLLPAAYDNHMRWLAYVAPRINKQVNKLLAQGKPAEALALLQLEPQR